MPNTRWRSAFFVASFLFLLVLLFDDRYNRISCKTDYATDPLLRHLQYYCNPLENIQQGDEGNVDRINKHGKYKLISVHVLTRHGDRMHLNRLPDDTAIKIPCEIDYSELSDNDDALHFQRTMNSYVGRKPNQTFYGMSVIPSQKYCDIGHLTPKGALQHVLTGRYLRSKYIEKHQLLDQMKPYDKQVLIKSTKYPRNFQSAIGFMHGFLPGVDPVALKIEKADNVTFCTKNSGVSCHCEAATMYKDIFPARHCQINHDLRSSRPLKPVYKSVAELFAVPEDKILPPSHNMDIFMVHFCHNTHLKNTKGDCLASRAIHDMAAALANNGQETMKDRDYLQGVKLKMHPLLNEISERMIKQSAGHTELKFVLYSGHDTTVEPLAAALGFSSGVWSRYAARISFELYQHTASAKQSIKVLYNGKSVTHLLPFCASDPQIERTELCPLREFVNFVRIGNIRDLGFTSYSQACSSPIDADPF